jgi:4-diphosphocytidyl-2-C-methyl-D-erythritol kinase
MSAMLAFTTQLAEAPYPGAVLAVVPEPVTVRVPAKVNLHLAVGNLRADGYHELVSVFQALSLTDEVTVAATDEPGVHVYGEGAGTVPTDERNLAWRAVLLLAEHAGRPPTVRVVLRKAIPVAGGMAGGSADAAGTLMALAALWRLDQPRRAHRARCSVGQ